jgi:hypothetical protein
MFVASDGERNQSGSDDLGRKVGRSGVHRNRGILIRGKERRGRNAQRVIPLKKKRGRRGVRAEVVMDKGGIG